MKPTRTSMILGGGALLIGAGILIAGPAQASGTGDQKVTPAAPVPAGATVVDGGVLPGGPSAAELARMSSGSDAVAVPMPADGSAPVPTGIAPAAEAVPVPEGATVVDGGVLPGGPSAEELAAMASGPPIEVPVPDTTGEGVRFGESR